MSVSRRYTVIFAISLSMTLFINGCNTSKVSQCQRLIKSVNQGTSLLDKNKGSQVITSHILANELEAVTKTMRQMNLNDPELKKFQNNFVKVFEAFTQSLRKASRALGSAKLAEPSPTGRVRMHQARGEIDAALNAAETAAKKSDTLADKVNKYCSLTGKNDQ